MKLFPLGVLLLLIWSLRYFLSSWLPHKSQRGLLWLFFSILGLAFFVLLFMILKTLFAIAIPAIILLCVLLATRKR